MLGAGKLGELIVAIGANTSGLDKGLGNATSSVQLFGKNATTNFQTVGKTAMLMGTAVVGVMTAITAASIRVGAEFEQEITNTVAVAQGGMKSFEREARRIGQTTQKTATEAAKAMYNFASAGWGVKGSLEAAGPAVSLAIATQSDLTQVSKLLASSMQALGDSYDQAGRYADVYAQATRYSQLTTTKLVEAMKYAAPTGRALGWSLEKTTAAVAMFANLGLEGSQSGTNLRMAMIQLGKGSDKTVAALDSLGLKFEDVDPQLNDFGEIVRTLAETDLVSLSDAVDLFGGRAGAAMLSMVMGLREGKFEFDEVLAKLEEAGGVSEEMRALMEDTVLGQFLMLKSAIAEIGLSIYDLIKKPLKDFLKVMVKIATVIGNWIKNHQTLSLVIGVTITVVGALIVVMGALIVVVPIAAAAIAFLGATIGVVEIAVMGAVLAIGALIAIVGALAIAWHYNLGSIQEYTIGTVVNIQGWLEQQALAIVGFWVAVANAISAAVGAAMKNASDALAAGLNALMNAWTAFASNLISFFSNLAQAVAAAASGDFAQAMGHAAAAVASGVTAIASSFAWTAQAVTTTFDGLSNHFNEVAGAADQAWTATTSQYDAMAWESKKYFDDLSGMTADSIDDTNDLASAWDKVKAMLTPDPDALPDKPDGGGGGGKKPGGGGGGGQKGPKDKGPTREDALEFWASIMDRSRTEYENHIMQMASETMELTSHLEQRLLMQEEYDAAVAALREQNHIETMAQLNSSIDAYAGYFDQLGKLTGKFGDETAASSVKAIGSYLSALLKLYVFFAQGENRKMLITAKTETVEGFKSLAAQDWTGAALHFSAAAAGAAAAGEILGIIADLPLPGAKEGAVILAHGNEVVVPFERMGEAFAMWKGAGGGTDEEGAGGGINVTNIIDSVNTDLGHEALLEEIGETIEDVVSRG